MNGIPKKIQSVFEEVERLIIFMLALFAVSLLHPTLMHLYLIIILPLVVSYLFTPYVADFVFNLHRKIITIPKVRTRLIKPTSIEYYYRFRLQTGANLFQILVYSTYPFLFFVSILFQTIPQPNVSYFFGMASVFNMLVFSPIFVLSAVIWVLDWSGLRYVNARSQYIERLGVWFGSKFRGLTGIFAVASLIWRIAVTGDIFLTLYEVMQICVIFYIQILITTVFYFWFVLQRDLGKFEQILSRKYKIKPQRVEFDLKSTPFYHSSDGKS